MRMTPIRWFFLILGVAGVYAAIVGTAACYGRLIPQQLHSFILTAFTGSVLYTALDASAARRDARRQVAEASPRTALEDRPDNVVAFELGRQAERNSNGGRRSP